MLVSSQSGLPLVQRKTFCNGIDKYRSSKLDSANYDERDAQNPNVRVALPLPLARPARHSLLR